MVESDENRGKAFRATSPYRKCPNLGQCPQRVHPAMRGLRITATMSPLHDVCFLAWGPWRMARQPPGVVRPQTRCAAWC